MRISDWSSDVCSSDLHFVTIDRCVLARERSRCGRHAIHPIGRPRQRRGLRGGRIGSTSVGRGGNGRRRCRYRGAACRSEERRVGKECDRACSSWWSTYHTQKKHINNTQRQRVKKKLTNH